MSDDRLTLETTRFGAIDVTPEQIVNFPKGLLGFETRQRFVFIDNPEHEPFAYLQSIDDPALAFIIVNPRLFFSHYRVQIDPPEIAELSVSDLSRVGTYVIVTVPDDIMRMSVNLQGPLLINRDNNTGKQVVLMRSPYTTCHYLMDELKKAKPTRAAKIPEAASV